MTTTIAPTLLHLDAGANRSTGSVGRALGRVFTDVWRAAHGDAGYRHRDLVLDPVPPLDTADCTLGRRVERRGRDPRDTLDTVATVATNPAERRAWERTRPLIDELLAAGTVLVTAPTYNDGPPAALKAWIDRVGFPGAFRDPATGASLLAGTRVVVIAPRGGTARPGTDFHTPYLRAWFARSGVAESDVHVVIPELTLAGFAPHLSERRPAADRSLSAARERVAALARVAATAPLG